MMGFSLETTLAPSDEQGKTMFDQDLALQKKWQIDEGTFSIQIFYCCLCLQRYSDRKFSVFHNVDTSSVCVCVYVLLNVLKQRWRKISYFRIFSATLAQPVGADVEKARSFVFVIWEPQTASPIIGNQSKDLQFANMTSRMKMILLDGEMQF